MREEQKIFEDKAKYKSIKEQRTNEAVQLSFSI